MLVRVPCELSKCGLYLMRTAEVGVAPPQPRRYNRRHVQRPLLAGCPVAHPHARLQQLRQWRLRGHSNRPPMNNQGWVYGRIQLQITHSSAGAINFHGSNRVADLYTESREIADRTPLRPVRCKRRALRYSSPIISERPTTMSREDRLAVWTATSGSGPKRGTTVMDEDRGVLCQHIKRVHILDG